MLMTLWITYCTFGGLCHLVAASTAMDKTSCASMNQVVIAQWMIEHLPDVSKFYVKEFKCLPNQEKNI